MLSGEIRKNGSTHPSDNFTVRSEGRAQAQGCSFESFGRGLVSFIRVAERLCGDKMSATSLTPMD